MTVTVEGASALDTAVGSTAWSDVPVPTPWPGGTHQVQGAFTNDYLGGGCDRNLRLDRVSVQPAAVPTPPPAGRLFGLSSTGPDQGIGRCQAS